MILPRFDAIDLPIEGGFRFVGVFSDGSKSICSVSFHDANCFFEADCMRSACGRLSHVTRGRGDLVAWFPAPMIDADVVSRAMQAA